MRESACVRSHGVCACALARAHVDSRGRARKIAERAKKCKKGIDPIAKMPILTLSQDGNGPLANEGASHGAMVLTGLKTLTGRIFKMADKNANTTEQVIDSVSPETTATNDTAATPAASGALVPLLDVDKVKSIRSKLGDRNTFDSDENATAFEKANKHLESAASATNAFHGLHIAVGPGLEEAPRIVVATVGVRDKGDAKAGIPARNGYKAIVVMSQPPVTAFLADESEAAKNFVAKLIEREATDVAFSGIRTADSVEELTTVMAGLPDTVAGIVENARVGTGAGQSSFDVMWADFRKGFIKVKYPQLDAVLPQKPIIIAAMKSKSYALANPATKAIEEAGLFVKIANAMRKAAESFKNEEGEVEPLDTTDIGAWIDNRDSVVIDYKVPEVKAADLAGLDF